MKTCRLPQLNKHRSWLLLLLWFYIYILICIGTFPCWLFFEKQLSYSGKYFLLFIAKLKKCLSKKLKSSLNNLIYSKNLWKKLKCLYKKMSASETITCQLQKACIQTTQTIAVLKSQRSQTVYTEIFSKIELDFSSLK